MNDEREKIYHPLFDDGKHLAKDKDGFNLGSTLNDSNNKLSGQARWVEVDPSSLKSDTSLRDEILINMAVKATEIGVSYFVSWAAPRIVDFWHETILPAAKKQFLNLVGRISDDTDSENTVTEIEYSGSLFDREEERIEEIISETDQKWSAYHNSPEYILRNEQVNKKLAERKSYFESLEFQCKRDEIMRRSEDRKAYYESPEYKKKVEERKRRVEERKAYYESPEYKKRVEERKRRSEERMAQRRQKNTYPSDETQIAAMHSDIVENFTRESEGEKSNQKSKRPMVSEEYQFHVANIRRLAILIAHEINAISDAYEVEQIPQEKRIEARSAVEEIMSKSIMDGVSYLLKDENRALLDQSTLDILEAFSNRCFLIYGEAVPIELLDIENEGDAK